MTCTKIPTITEIRQKYPQFNSDWTTSAKDSIIRTVLHQLSDNETRLIGIKNVCKKRWSFLTGPECTVVSKDISRRFNETKQKYVPEFGKKFPAIFAKKVATKHTVYNCMNEVYKDTMEKTFKVTFESLVFNLNESDFMFLLKEVVNRHQSNL